MLRHLAVAILGLIGDLSYVRLCVALGAGLAVSALVHWLALPAVFPLWPAIVLVTAAAIAGLVWERKVAKGDDLSGRGHR